MCFWKSMFHFYQGLDHCFAQICMMNPVLVVIFAQKARQRFYITGAINCSQPGHIFLIVTFHTRLCPVPSEIIKCFMYIKWKFYKHVKFWEVPQMLLKHSHRVPNQFFKISLNQLTLLLRIASLHPPCQSLLSWLMPS